MSKGSAQTADENRKRRDKEMNRHVYSGSAQCCMVHLWLESYITFEISSVVEMA